MTRTLSSIFAVVVSCSLGFAADVPATAPADASTRVPPQVAPANSGDATRGKTPQTRPARDRKAVEQRVQRRAERAGRKAEITPVAAARNPDRPGRPTLPTGPRYAAPSPPQPWLPLPTLHRLRPESPVRAHEPVLDPMGGTELNVLPIWRTTPAAAHRAQIPDPYENYVPIAIHVPDTDPPVSVAEKPGKPVLRAESSPTTRPAGNY